MKHRILITGGAGFIGSHLARELAASGHHVRVLDNLSPQVHGENGNVPEIIKDRVEFLLGDVRSRSDLSKALEGIDIVYHFAASVGVGQSMYEIHSYVDQNNLGTANLLQLLIDRPVKKLVIASSMSIYGEGLYRDRNGRVHSNVRRSLDRVKQKLWEPVDIEGNTLEPIATPEDKIPDLASIYALTKYDQERMCLIVGQAYKIPTIALRFFNVYGPGQSLSNPYTGVLAIFASRLLNDKAPIIFEDGEQLRDFVHVSDIVQACQLAIEVPEAEGKVFNVGSGSQFRVKEIATSVAKAMGKSHITPEITQELRVGDIRNCFADITHTQRVLHYRPQVNFTSGIQELVKWLSAQRAVDRSSQMRSELAARGLAL